MGYVFIGIHIDLPFRRHRQEFQLSGSEGLVSISIKLDSCVRLTSSSCPLVLEATFSLHIFITYDKATAFVVEL